MDDVVCHSLKSEAKNPPAVAGPTGSELVDLGSSSSSPSISDSSDSGLSTTPPHRDPTPFTAKLNTELNLKFISFNEGLMKRNQCMRNKFF